MIGLDEDDRRVAGGGFPSLSEQGRDSQVVENYRLLPGGPAEGASGASSCLLAGKNPPQRGFFRVFLAGVYVNHETLSSLPSRKVLGRFLFGKGSGAAAEFIVIEARRLFLRALL